jgi:hypothetical protein
MGMRRIFWGFCRNWFLIDPLDYLSSRSAFGFVFAEIFEIEKRLRDSASWGVDDSPTWRVGKSATEFLQEKSPGPLYILWLHVTCTADNFLGTEVEFYIISAIRSLELIKSRRKLTKE